MKKLTLSIGLIAAMLSSNAQDTTCTMVQQSRIIEFDYKTNEIINIAPVNGSYFISIRKGEVCVLHLYDKIHAKRVIITTFPDNSQLNNTFNSKSNVYYSPVGPCIVEVKQLEVY